MVGTGDDPGSRELKFTSEKARPRLTFPLESPRLDGPVRSGGIQLVSDPNLVGGDLRIGEDLIEPTGELRIGPGRHRFTL